MDLSDSKQDQGRGFVIGSHRIGPGNPCFITAEVAQAHDGDIDRAHAYIDAVAGTGADAVKFQTHIAAAESTPAEPWRVKFSDRDETRYDYWKRMEFTEAQWVELAQHASDKGLVFMSSPFSSEAVDLLERVGVPAWKVGAGELTTWPMLRQMAATGKPVLLSTGMSTEAELAEAVRIVRHEGAPVGIYQCTTAYPCPPEQWGLHHIRLYKHDYDCPAGLSDHSGDIYAGLAAAAIGADMLEVHITLERGTGLPDEAASLTPDTFAELVQGVKEIRQAMESPVDKDKMAGDLEELRHMFGKSIVAARDLPAGHVLTFADVALKKPGTGLTASRLEDVVGRSLRHAVDADTLLSEEDLA